jgi:hypothetical protein
MKWGGKGEKLVRGRGKGNPRKENREMKGRKCTGGKGKRGSKVESVMKVCRKRNEENESDEDGED